uniref:Uncharacterized protein n=1 Tax=Arundo donax TaxID=35708 RepID=A0A0A9B571_ARUDO
MIQTEKITMPAPFFHVSLGSYGYISAFLKMKSCMGKG